MSAQLGEMFQRLSSYLYPMTTNNSLSIEDELIHAEFLETVNDLNLKLVAADEKIKSYTIMVEQLLDIIARKDTLLASQEQTCARLFKLVLEYRTAINNLYGQK